MTSIDDLLFVHASLEQSLIDRCMSECDDCRNDVLVVRRERGESKDRWYHLCEQHALAVRAVINPEYFRHIMHELEKREVWLSTLIRVKNGLAYIDENPSNRERAEIAIRSLLSSLPLRYNVMDTTKVDTAIEEIRQTIAAWRQVETTARGLTG